MTNGDTADISPVVRGTVRYAGGLGVSGAVVVAVNRLLRSEVELGRGVTDAGASFEIGYHTPESMVSLQIRVFGAGGTPLVAESR